MMATTRRRNSEIGASTRDAISTAIDERLAQIQPARSQEKLSPKRAAFLRIVGPRLETMLAYFETLGQTADHTRYEFGNEDIEFIQTQLTNALIELIEKFKRGNPRPKLVFPEYKPH